MYSRSPQGGYEIGNQTPAASDLFFARLRSFAVENHHDIQTHNNETDLTGSSRNWTGSVESDWL